jgi:hypothetical protein
LPLGALGGVATSPATTCSVFGALNGNLLVGPRLLYATGEDGLAPRSLRRVHPRYHTLAWAIAVAQRAHTSSRSNYPIARPRHTSPTREQEIALRSHVRLVWPMPSPGHRLLTSWATGRFSRNLAARSKRCNSLRLNTFRHSALGCFTSLAHQLLIPIPSMVVNKVYG